MADRIYMSDINILMNELNQGRSEDPFTLDHAYGGYRLRYQQNDFNLKRSTEKELYYQLKMMVMIQDLVRKENKTNELV